MLEVGTIFQYTDEEHRGTCDDLSGVYRIVDTSNYPRRVGVELIMWEGQPHDGTSGILGWNEQVSSGAINIVAMCEKCGTIADQGDWVFDEDECEPRCLKCGEFLSLPEGW